MVSWGEAFTFSKSLANLRLTVNIFPKKSSDKFFTVLFFLRRTVKLCQFLWLTAEFFGRFTADG